MGTLYCKLVECEWNRYDEQNLKYRCNKTITQIDRNGYCSISQFATSIEPPKATQAYCKEKSRLYNDLINAVADVLS